MVLAMMNTNILICFLCVSTVLILLNHNMQRFIVNGTARTHFSFYEAVSVTNDLICNKGYGLSD